MLDRYLQWSATRLCQEAPVPVVTIADCQNVPGGAANTAVNLRSLGAQVSLISAIGDDWEGIAVAKRVRTDWWQTAITAYPMN